jgi:hypothetical protein
MIGLVVGGFIGWLRPDWGNAVYFLRDIFINLIKSIIAPLVFSTIVVGIAGAGALRKVGRMGIKALIYFEILTTAALVIGLAVVNLTKPGAGVALAAANTDVLKTISQSHSKTLVETIVHVFPSSVIEAMVRGDVLQIVAFSVLFALAVSAVGEKGKPIVRAMDSLRVGVTESDGVDGAFRSAAPYCGVRDADRLFVQPDRIDVVSGNGIGVRCASRRDDNRVAHVVRPANYHDVNVDAYFQGSGRRAAGIACHSAGGAEFVHSIRDRTGRCGRDIWRGRVDGYGPHMRKRDRQLSRNGGCRPLGR